MLHSASSSMSESFAAITLSPARRRRLACCRLLDRTSCRCELLARVLDGDELTVEDDTRCPVTLEELQPVISDLQLLLGLFTGDLRCPKIDDSVSTKIKRSTLGVPCRSQRRRLLTYRDPTGTRPVPRPHQEASSSSWIRPKTICPRKKYVWRALPIRSNHQRSRGRACKGRQVPSVRAIAADAASNLSAIRVEPISCAS